MGEAVRYWVSCVMVPADQQVPLAVAAEELGFEGVTYPDHPVMPERITSPYPGGTVPWAADSDWPDVWVLIAAAAARTQRLRFATNVYVLPARHPLVVARAVATAAWVSGGRVALGVGVGWMAEESMALGEDFRTRGRRTDEAIAVLRGALAGGPTEHHGEFFDFPPLHVRPTSPTPVPIWVGGESEAALRRAAHADGWITEHPVERTEGWLERIREHRAAAGLDDDGYEVAVACWRPPTDADLDAFARLGVDHVKVQPWQWHEGDRSTLATKLAALERFAERHLR
jgi:probable F420-dependent oxidoreductase